MAGNKVVFSICLLIVIESYIDHLLETARLQEKEERNFWSYVKSV